jgi:hypothetical protein
MKEAIKTQYESWCANATADADVQDELKKNRGRRGGDRGCVLPEPRVWNRGAPRCHRGGH